jgi:hypothetical protein
MALVEVAAYVLLAKSFRASDDSVIESKSIATAALEPMLALPEAFAAAAVEMRGE